MLHLVWSFWISMMDDVPLLGCVWNCCPYRTSCLLKICIMIRKQHPIFTILLHSKKKLYWVNVKVHFTPQYTSWESFAKDFLFRGCHCGAQDLDHITSVCTSTYFYIKFLQCILMVMIRTSCRNKQWIVRDRDNLQVLSSHFMMQYKHEGLTWVQRLHVHMNPNTSVS